MRLFISAASPFARKCQIVAREKGLMGRIEEVVCDFPYKDDAFLAVNPLGQVPALEMDDGSVMTDSALISAWLDAMGSGPRLTPPEGPGHWEARRREILGVAVLEMAVKIIMEIRRPDGARSDVWLGHWGKSLKLALDQAEAQAPAPDTLDMGSITLACAVTYLDFRRAVTGYAMPGPKLLALRDALEARPSFRETLPR